MKEALPVVFFFSLDRSIFPVALFFLFLVFKSHERATQSGACIYNTIAPDPSNVNNVRKAYQKVVLKCNLT